ncbi:hypothetical protein M0802_011339 [Mischocyttarus mexicanus]|nr:hypothetical protein M0802_011339 [Mischocyttarus mexicanus]
MINLEDIINAEDIINVEGIINAEDIINVEEEEPAQICWSDLMSFGSVSTAMMEIFIILSIVKLKADTIIRGYTFIRSAAAACTCKENCGVPLPTY